MRPTLLKIYNIVFALLVFFIPMSGKLTAVPNILLIILIPLFVVLFNKNELKSRLLKPELIAFLFFVLLTFIIVSIKGNINHELDLFGRYGLAILFLLLATPVTNLKYLKYAIILSVITMAVYTFVLSGFYIVQNGSFDIAKGGEIKKLLITERLYTGFFSALSFLFSLDLISGENKKIRRLHYLNLFLTLTFVLVVSSRMALLIMITVLFYRYLLFNKSKKAFIGLFAGISFIVLLFILNPNLSNRFFHLNRDKGIIENFKNWEPRLVIWSCVNNLIQDDQENYNLFLGFGSEYITNNKLVECYSSQIEKKGRRNYFLKSRFNAHNQFLTFLMAYGLVALLLFLAIFIIPLIYRKKSLLKGSIILAVFMFGLIESFLSRQMGSYILGILLVIVVSFKYKNEQFKFLFKNR